jgi:hypothetical protein
MDTIIGDIGKVRTVVAVQVAVQDGFVCINIPLIGVRCARTGVATFKSYAVNKLECSVTVAGAVGIGGITIG